MVVVGGWEWGWGSMGSELAALPSPRSRTNTASAYIHLPLGPALLSAAAEPCTPTLACAVQVWTDVLNHVLLDDFRRARRERSAQCAERQTGDMDISTVILPPPFRLLAAETAHWDSHAHTHTHKPRDVCVTTTTTTATAHPPPPLPAYNFLAKVLLCSITGTSAHSTRQIKTARTRLIISYHNIKFGADGVHLRCVLCAFCLDSIRSKRLVDHLSAKVYTELRV
jgi:hypothetical protein